MAISLVVQNFEVKEAHLSLCRIVDPLDSLLLLSVLNFLFNIFIYLIYNDNYIQKFKVSREARIAGKVGLSFFGAVKPLSLKQFTVHRHVP